MSLWKEYPVMIPDIYFFRFMGHKTKRVKWNSPDDGESLLISVR